MDRGAGQATVHTVARGEHDLATKQHVLHAKSLQSCLTLCDPMDCSPPGSLSMEFSRQEYWSG